MNFREWSNEKFYLTLLITFAFGMILSVLITSSLNKDNAKSNTTNNQAATSESDKIKNEPFTPLETTPTPNIINKKIGEEIKLNNVTFTITSSSEEKVISSKYRSPQSAKEDAKFVIVNMSVVNTTNSEFQLFADDLFVLRDSQGREYKHYDSAIGHADIYKLLDVKSLAPSIKASGFFIYEVPNDSTNYQLVTIDSQPQYKIVLK